MRRRLAGRVAGRAVRLLGAALLAAAVGCGPDASGTYQSTRDPERRLELRADRSFELASPGEPVRTGTWEDSGGGVTLRLANGLAERASTGDDGELVMRDGRVFARLPEAD